MKKLLSGVIVTLMLACMLTVAFSIQQADPKESPSIEWNKTYGGAKDDVAWSLIQTKEGGYAMAGQTGDPISGGWPWPPFWMRLPVWLVKTNPVGQMEWNKTYTGMYPPYGESLVQTRDGGYALTGACRCDRVQIKKEIRRSYMPRSH